MKDTLISALTFVSARVDDAISAVERDDFAQAQEEIRNAEARLRMLASSEGAASS